MADKIDKPLNAVPVVTSDDINQIEALFAKMSNGEIKVVTKADLAGVVAGVGSFIIGRGRFTGDLNTLNDFGIYSFTAGDTTNNAVNAASILIVYGYQKDRIIQVQIAFNGGIYSRFLTTSWSTWSQS